MDKKKRRNLIIIISIFALVLGMQMVNANLFEDLKEFFGEITGKVVADTTTASVTLASKTPNITNISFPPIQTITENSFINVSFDFLVTDPDGAGDIDNKSAHGYINITGGIADRFNFTCETLGSVNSTTNRYNCTVDIWFFDTDGDWTINVSINDSSGNYYEDSTNSSFTLSSTRGMQMSPTAISWSSINLGSTNTLSGDDPITINNTGNANHSIINVTGYNLHGTTTGAEFIYAGNFSSNVSDSCNTNAFLGNNTNSTIITASASPGNHTPDDGTAQEQLYFCLEAIEGAGESLSVQTYDTSNSFPWEITVV